MSYHQVIRYLQLYLLGLVVMVSLNCNSSKKDWEEAELENTISAYETFIALNPNGSFAGKAKIRLEQLCFEEAYYINTIPAYKDFLKRYQSGDLAEKAHEKIENLNRTRKTAVQNIRVVYANIKDSHGIANGIYIPFIDVASSLLEFADVEVTTEYSQACDANLEFTVMGKALDEYYVNLGRRYTGAEISGYFILRINGDGVYKQYFKGIKEPPYSTGAEAPTSSSDAPFSEAFWASDFNEKFAKLLCDLFGVSTLKAILYHYENEELRYYLLDSIHNMPDTSFIPALIQIGGNKNRWGRGCSENVDDLSLYSDKVLPIIVSMEKAAIDPLLIAINRNHYLIYSTEVLRSIDKQLAFNHLMELFNKSNSMELRTEIAYALGCFRDSSAVKPLLATFANANKNKYWHEHLIKNAIFSLGIIGDRRAIEPLKEIAKYESYADEAKEALENFNSQY